MASIKDKWSKVHSKATGSGAWNGGTAASEDEEIRNRWQNNNNTASYSGTTVMQGDLARAAAVSRLQNQQRAQASTGAADQNSPTFDMGLRAGAVERAVRGQTVQLPGTVQDLGELPAFSKLEDTKSGSNEEKYSAVNRYFAENPTAQKLWNLERGYNPNQNATAARKKEAEAIRAGMSDDELRAYNDATALYDSYGKGYSVGKRTKDLLEGSLKGALDSMAVFIEGMPAASSEENKQAQWEMRQAMDNGTVFTQDDDGNLKVSDDYKKALDTFEKTKDDSPVLTEDFAPALKRNRERAAQVQRGGEGLSGAAAKTYELGASMAGNAGSMALGLVPGIGQALSLGTLGLQAAGSRVDELSARDIPTREALARGAVSGGIEVGTEMVPIGEWVPEQIGKWIKRPVKNWIKIVQEGGESVAENIAKQALGEATEEGTSYVLNYLADLAYKDPDAEFSLDELADNMVMGAASGAVYGAVGTGINRALGGSANVQNAPAYRHAPDGVVNEGTIATAQQETAAPMADNQAAAPVNVAQQAADQAFVQDLLQQVQDATAPEGQQTAQNVDEQNLLREIAAQRQMVDTGMTTDEAETAYREQAQAAARQAQEEARQRMAEQEAARQAVQQESAKNTAQSRMQEVQRIAAEAPSYNDAMRQAFTENYQGGSVDAYTQAMDGMYNAGRTGALTYEQALDAVGAAGAVVNDQQALQAAYQAGSEGVSAPVDPAGAGAVQGSVTYENELTRETSHVPAEVLDLTAKKLGVDITVVQNLTDGDGNAVNGHWAAGLSQIALGENSSNTYQTLMHELTHYLGSYNAEGLARTCNAVLDFYSRNAGMTAAQEHVFEQYENTYGNSAVGADEAARDILSGIMSTEDGVQQFCDYLNDAGMYSTAEKKTILQTVRDMIAKIVEKLRAIIRTGDATQGAAEGRKLAERADAMGEAASIIDDFIAELDVARQNAQEKGQGENVQVEQNEGEKKYSYAGVNAEQADTNALERAQQMEADDADSEDIRRETGWFRGADGKWRFEIDDSKATWNRRGDNSAKSSNADYALYQKLTNDFLYGTIDSEGLQQLTELDKVYKNHSTGNKVGDYLDAPELYKQYPQLKEVSLTFKDMGSTLGQRTANGIVLNEKFKNANMSEQAKSTLLHEVQHWIQKKEGFAAGASPEYWQNELENGEKIVSKQYKNNVATVLEIGDKYDERGIDIKPYADKYLAGWTDEEILQACTDAEKNGIDTDDLTRYAAALWGATNDGPVSTDPKVLYTNTAGEIEARDVQARRNFTEEQRRNTKPDVGDANTVFAGETARALSIDTDADGKPFVEVDENILDGVEQKAWAKTVMNTLKERFPDGFMRDGWKIELTREGRKEFTSSKDTKLMRVNEPVRYADKMRMAANLGEIVSIANEIRNEMPKHERTDGILSFNRSGVQVRVGNTDYTADVVTGIKPGSREIFYNITNLQETQIKKAPTEQQSAKKSSLATDVGEGASYKNSIAQTENNVKKRFSMDVPVEETKDLVAVHNVDEDSLDRSLDLGGMPMPSIAVVKSEQGHTKYGPISLVFGKDSIDPQLNSKNRVYGGDGWTPTKPRVDYEVNYDAARQFENSMSGLSKQVAGGTFDAQSILRKRGVGETSNMNIKELAKELAGDDSIRAAYLADNGKTLEPVLKDRVWDKYGNDSLQRFTDAVGVQRLAEINAELEAGTSVNTALGADADTARSIIRDYYAKSQESMVQRAAARNGWTAEQTDVKRQERLNRTMQNSVTPFTVEDFVKHAWDMYTDGGNTKGDVDRYETSAKLRNAVDDTQVAKWVQGKLEGVLGKSGVYNGKDPYTPSGNSRSFDQLHYPETLENLVRVMSETQEERGEGVWGLTASGLQSVSTPSYDSIAAMKKDSSRLGSAESESYKAQMQAVDDQIGEVIGKIQQETKSHSDNPFEEADIIGNVIMEAAGKKSAAAIRNVFAKEGYTISTDTAKQLLMLYSDAAELPTEYFEAKPRRAVGFDEVKAAIVPDNTNPAVREKLEKAGVPVVEYAAGDEAARLKALNDLNDVRFSKNSNAQTDSEATLQEKLTETQRQNRELARKVTKAQEQADYWRQETQLTGGHQVDPKALRQAATDFLSRYESSYDRATFTEELQRAFATIKKDGSNTTEALETLTSLARSALRESTRVDTTARDYYAPVRELLRSTPMLVQEGSPEYADLLAAFGDGANGKRSWGNVRKNTFGRLDLKLVPSGQSGNIDTVVQEMSGNWPNIFDESAAPSDNVQRALDVFGASAIEYHDIYGSDLDQAAAHAGQELMDAYLTMPAKQTRADKQLAKLQETRRTLQAEKKAALATQKQAYEARVKELEAGQSARKAQLRAKYLETTRKAAVANNTDTAARLTKQANGYKAQLAELNSYDNKTLNKKLIDQQARYEILNQRRNDTILQTRARDSVQKSVQQLYRWLSKPNDAGHVQTRMEKAVYDLLTQIDPNTSSDNTKTAVRWQETMKDIRSMAQEALAADRGEADVADYADFDPDLPNSIKELLDDAGSMSLRDMNGRQTQMLADILTSMKTSIQNANKMLSEGRAAKVEEVATKSIHEMEGVKASQLKTRNELVGKMADSRTYDMVSQLLGLDMMDARRFFSSLGSTVEQEVYKPIRDGFDKRVWKLEAAQEQFAKIKGDTDISKWTGNKANKQTFTLGNGQTIELTVGQMMELYNLSQRPQAKDHLMQGGISIMQDGKRGRRLKIDATDLANITGALTNEQVRMARAMAGYLSAADGPAGWGNEVTQTLYGLDKFREGYYWPIKTDSNYTRTSDATATDTAGLYAIKNQGFTKALQRKANNPLLINDAFDTWCDHVANMATYNAWAIPLSDAMKWYNYKAQDANTTLSTKEALEGVYGAKGKKYFQTLMQDINGVSAGAAQTGYARMTKSVIRNWKVAKVGANLRVAIQQPTAYMRAAAVIDPKYLAGALGYDVGRLQQGMDRAESNCGIAKWKSWGYFETNIGQTMKSVLTGETDPLDKVREKSTQLAELGDRVTWGTLWNACELEAKDKGMKAGSQESIDYCAQRLSEIVDKTQVVDSVLHRSQIMRSKDMLAQMATNFFAEPTKTYSMMAEAAVKLAHKDKGAKAYMGRVTATYLATAFATSAASSLIDAWRVSDDDKDKGFGGRYLNALWDGFVDNINMINNIPFFKDIKSIFDGYDATRTDMEAATDLYNALSAWQKLLSGNGGKTTPYKLLYKTANAFADISGIPTGTAVREVKSAYDLVTGMQDPLHVDEAIANSNAKMNSRIARGNMDEAQDLLDDLAQKKVDSGKTEKEAKSTMRSSLTGYWKPLYVAADDAGRAEIAAKLLGLKCFGEVIYTQKDLDKWVKDSSK